MAWAKAVDLGLAHEKRERLWHEQTADELLRLKEKWRENQRNQHGAGLEKRGVFLSNIWFFSV